jgi:hypothetical protein
MARWRAVLQRRLAAMGASGWAGLRKAMPKTMFFGAILLLVAWQAHSVFWPLRLSEPTGPVEEEAATMPARAQATSFESSKPIIRSKDLFAPPVPVLSNAAGAVVIEELLKKVQLAGITNLGGQPAAIIRLSGKGGIYKAGDPLGNFVVKEILGNKVVLEIDGQPVELTM